MSLLARYNDLGKTNDAAGDLIQGFGTYCDSDAEPDSESLFPFCTSPIVSDQVQMFYSFVSLLLT